MSLLQRFRAIQENLRRYQELVRQKESSVFFVTNHQRDGSCCPSPPVVSVLIPAYNEERYIYEAIESIITQSYRELDIIVVDDGSSDRTPDILQEWSRREQRIRVVHQENQGIVGALNRALAEAQGSYIARMDANDTCLSHRIERQVNYLRAFPEVGLVSAWKASTDAEGELLGSVWQTPVLPGEVAWALHFGNAVVHAAFLARRSVLERVKGYRKEGVEHLEDYDLMLRLLPHCLIANLPEVLYLRRELSSGVTHRFAEVQAKGVKRRMAEVIAHTTGEPIDEPLVDALFCLHREQRISASMVTVVQKRLLDLYGGFVGSVELNGVERSRVDFDVARKLVVLAAQALRFRQPTTAISLLRKAVRMSPVELPLRAATRVVGRLRLR